MSTLRLVLVRQPIRKRQHFQERPTRLLPRAIKASSNLSLANCSFDPLSHCYFLIAWLERPQFHLLVKVTDSKGVLAG